MADLLIMKRNEKAAGFASNLVKTPYQDVWWGGFQILQQLMQRIVCQVISYRKRPSSHHHCQPSICNATATINIHCVCCCWGAASCLWAGRWQVRPDVLCQDPGTTGAYTLDCYNLRPHQQQQPAWQQQQFQSLQDWGSPYSCSGQVQSTSQPLHRSASTDWMRLLTRIRPC